MTAQSGFRHPMTIKPKVPANIILWIILAFVLVAIGWAALTEIDRTVRGNGRVIPSSQLQVVSNLEGGVVEQIMVKVGQDVRQGTPLVRLSPVQPGAEWKAILPAAMLSISRSSG